MQYSAVQCTVLFHSSAVQCIAVQFSACCAFQFCSANSSAVQWYAVYCSAVQFGSGLGIFTLWINCIGENAFNSAHLTLKRSLSTQITIANHWDPGLTRHLQLRPAYWGRESGLAGGAPCTSPTPHIRTFNIASAGCVATQGTFPFTRHVHVVAQRKAGEIGLHHCTVWKTIEEMALRIRQLFRGLINFSLSFTFILSR